MTFLEAALEILKREGRPLHFKELTERAMTKKLLTFVGRTPEVTMQTQLTAAIKKAPGNPFVRVKPGTFGLLRYPEMAPEEVAKVAKKEEPTGRSGASESKSSPEKTSARASSDRKKDDKRTEEKRPEEKRADDADGERGRRRRRRGGRTTRGGKESESESPARVAARTSAKATSAASAAPAGQGGDSDRESDGEPDTERLSDGMRRESANEHPDEHMDDPSAGRMSAEARAAALAETGVLEGDGDDSDGSEEDEGREPVRARGEGDGGDTGSQRGDRADQADSQHADGQEDSDPEDRNQAESDDELDDRTFASAPAEAPSAARPSRDARGGGEAPRAAGEGSVSATRASDPDDDEDDDDEPSLSEDVETSVFGESAPADASAGELGDDPARRRRRRRRRRRGPNGDGPATDEGAGTTASGAGVTSEGAVASSPAAEGSAEGHGQPAAAAAGLTSAGSAVPEPAPELNGQAARKILAPIDAAIEVLRSQPPGRGVHVRQIADSAIRKRLIHGEPNEAWRVIRTALATEPKQRLRNGTRPRVRSAGSGLFALARRPPEAELEKAEHVFGEARRALRERTMAALEKRVAELPPGAFEALARVLLQREGFGPTTFVKRVEGTIYVEALRGRGSRPSRCLIALRAGGASAGRRAIGELRAGIRARNQDEGVLMLCGRLADDGISEWKQPGPPLEIVDGAALAETCARHGVGVQTATVTVDFVDGDFFAELSEG